MGQIVEQKLKELVGLYRKVTAQSGYSELLSYRVILICLTSNYREDINLNQEINRLFKYCLQTKQLDKIRLCFDILLLKQVKQVISEQYYRVFKVRILKTLTAYYQRAVQTKDRKLCGYTLQEYCKTSLQKDRVKINPDIYQEILDALLQQTKIHISKLVVRKKDIKAIEEMTSFVQFLQKSEHIVSSKYQMELMEGYWTLAKLHDRLHYLAYTRKYASIALNIAKRIQHSPAVNQLKLLIDRLA